MQQAVAGYKYQIHRYKQNIHNETNNNKGWYNDYAWFAAFSLFKNMLLSEFVYS